MRKESTTRTAAVKLEGVTKTYVVGEPIHAVKDVSLEIPEGSFTAVMGPSGSGKSTLMNLIGLLDTPSSGKLSIGGQEATALSDRERTRLRGKAIGFIFQSFNLMPKLSALDNVMLPMTFQGVVAGERVKRAQALLALMGLRDRMSFKPNQLSGGQRQRVAIARALANEPTLLLADEPTGNLDSRTGEEVMKLFKDLHTKGYTILLVTHERHIAEQAERIIHVWDSRVESIEAIQTQKEESAKRQVPTRGKAQRVRREQALT